MSHIVYRIVKVRGFDLNKLYLEIVGAFEFTYLYKTWYLQRVTLVEKNVCTQR